jgi:cob(I)alamin adenosyltransferase
MKIYTKTGDDGETGLYGGKRVSKDSLRIDAYGTVDELNAHLGVIRALPPRPEIDRELAIIQNDLFVLGADLATPAEKITGNIQRIQNVQTTRLEERIDQIDPLLSPLRAFILPGGSPVAAELHSARTICRRAERLVVRLSHEEPIGREPIVYLNRLSDFLFVIARYSNHLEGREEIPWKS